MAGQVRRHYRRRAVTRSPRGELRRLSRRMSLVSLPGPLLQGLNTLSEAAVAVLASHVRLHEVMALPASITQQIVNNTLANNMGHIQLTYPTEEEPDSPALDQQLASAGGARSNLLRAILPCLHSGGLCRLSLPHRIPHIVVGDLISSGVLSQPSLYSLHLCIVQLQLAAVAQLVSRATALTALALTDIDAQSEADAATAHQLTALQGVHTTDPSPGRPDAYLLLHHSSSTPVGPAEEAQAHQVALAISQSQQLQSLQLRPPLSLSSSFWQQLAQQSRLTSLDLAFLSPQTASQSSQTNAQNIFRALPLFPGLAELQLHGRHLSIEAEEAAAPRLTKPLTPSAVQALLEALPAMPRLSALTLQLRVAADRLAPLTAALAAVPTLRHLSLLLHPPVSAAEDPLHSLAFAGAWPALTSLSHLRSLSLPFAQLASAAEVFRSTHRQLTAFQHLQTLHLPFISLTQPDVWLHVVQLTALTALRLGGFFGPAGSVPDVWLQAVATAVCSCVHLRWLESESAVDEVLPWFGAYLSQLSALQDLRLTSVRPGARLTVSALTPALRALPALTRLELGSQAASGAAHGRHPGGFVAMQRQRAQSAALLAALGALTRLQTLCLWGVLTVESGAEEARVLGGSLRHLRQLSRLDLSHNVLAAEVMRVLAPHLGEVGGLRELALRECGVDDGSTVLLAGAVMALRDLRRLDVRGNFMGLRSAALLLSAVVELPLEEGVQL